MAVDHGVGVTDSTSPGSPNVQTTVNIVPFIMGNAAGPTGGDAPTTVEKISSFEEYKTIYGWSGASDDEPDTDYSLEEFAYLYFRKYKNSPCIMRNMFTTADFAGGVSTVAASDFTSVVDDADKAFSQFGIVPFFFACPEYSSDSTLRTAMEGKIDYNVSYKMYCVFDSDETNTVAQAVTDAATITADNVILAFPKYTQYNLSSHAICEAVKAARENSDVPFHSPSNYSILPTSLATADKSISADEALLLADAGVITRISRGISGYTIWNSWLASFGGGAGTPDYLNDTYIPRAMANYLRTLIVNNVWENVDDPTNVNLINSVVTKINTILGQMKSQGAVIGAKVEFLEADNPISQLQVGTIKFRVTYLTPKEASDIQVLLEVDTAYFSTLFTSI